MYIVGFHSNTLNTYVIGNKYQLTNNSGAHIPTKGSTYTV